MPSGSARRLAEITGIDLVTAADLVEATQDCGAFVQLSGVLKRVAVKLSKTCNDLRLLSSGPRAGLRRDQPAGRAGGLVDHAGQGQPGDPRGGQPGRLRGDRQRRHHHLRRRGRPAPAQRLRADHRLQPVPQPRPPARRLPDAGRANCVRGITANRERLRASVEQSIGIVTALNPYIGYRHATEVALEAHQTGRGVYELVLEKQLMPKAQLDAVLRPEMLTRPQPIVART